MTDENKEEEAIRAAFDKMIEVFDDYELSPGEAIDLICRMLASILNCSKGARDLERARVILDDSKASILDALERHGWE